MHDPIRILFICHGNICRSPMAEFIFRDMAERLGVADKFEVASAATSTEAIGYPVYSRAKKILAEHGISCEGKTARQITLWDYAYYDLLLCAENYNIRNMRDIIPSDPQQKIHRMLDFSAVPRDISDPWYTRDFERTYAELIEASQSIIDYLLADD